MPLGSWLDTAFAQPGTSSSREGTETQANIDGHVGGNAPMEIRVDLLQSQPRPKISSRTPHAPELLQVSALLRLSRGRTSWHLCWCWFLLC